MSWKNIKEAIYTIVENDLKTPAYHYNWETARRSDTRYTNAIATFIMEYPVETYFEDNSAPQTGMNSFETKHRRTVHFIGRVISDLGEVLLEEVIDKNNDALDKALEDITKAFCKSIPNTLCAEGVMNVEYIGASKRAIESAGNYYPYELVVTYYIDYITDICK